MINQKRITFIVIGTLPTLLIIYMMCLAHRQRLYYETPPPPLFKKADLALFDKWSKLSFVPIEPRKEFLAKLSVIPIVSTNSLDQDQAENVYLSIYQMLVGYHAGDYKNYKAFRLPITNGYFDKTMHNSLLELVKDHSIKKLEDLNNPAKLFEGFWDYMDELSKNGENIFCTRCLTECSVQSGKIVISELNSNPAILYHYMNSQENVKILDCNSSFIFHPDPEEILAKNGHLTFATVWIIVKGSHGYPFPLGCGFYWDSSDKVWLPLQLATGVAHSTAYHFMF